MPQQITIKKIKNTDEQYIERANARRKQRNWGRADNNHQQQQLSKSNRQNKN